MAEDRASFSKRQGIAAVVFLALALGLTQVTPSIEVAWVTGLLMLTIYLFAFEVVGVDVAALTAGADYTVRALHGVGAGSGGYPENLRWLRQ